jgi:hypothetical protein
MLPTPPEHLTAKFRVECLKCHLPETLAQMELQHKHPNKWRDERVECTRCHKPPQEANALNLNKGKISEFSKHRSRDFRPSGQLNLNKGKISEFSALLRRAD